MVKGYGDGIGRVKVRGGGRLKTRRVKRRGQRMTGVIRRLKNKRCRGRVNG
jgi:hypothetical protein